jgi:hypothetical protein
MKNSNENIGNRNRDLPACNAVPLPTAPPLAPFKCERSHVIFITVRLTFLAHSVRIRPNFQGLPCFECDGLGDDELLIRFFLN